MVECADHRALYARPPGVVTPDGARTLVAADLVLQRKKGRPSSDQTPPPSRAAPLYSSLPNLACAAASPLSVTALGGLSCSPSDTPQGLAATPSSSEVGLCLLPSHEQNSTIDHVLNDANPTHPTSIFCSIRPWFSATTAAPELDNLPADASWQCPGGTPCVFCEGGLPHPDDEEEDSDFDLTTTYDGSNTSDYTTPYEGEDDEDDEQYEDEDDDGVVYIIQHVHQLFITLHPTTSASVPEPASSPVVIVNERARVPLYYAVLLFLMEAFFSGGWHHFLLPHLLAFLLIYFD
ncbi:hypothetical protein R3P38DRAFT_3219032 [Favolaschia claudopus]|uniref:Uncharacterized protein n=1 Tax=Favolaschia claudopus TaxID=2862362 RepID=A0AAW0A236_9AGAR